jgi:5-methylcytosine-specific restriction protein A
MVQRTEISDNMIFTGYYLSRLSDNFTGRPPVGLGVYDWEDAYDMFYDALSGGRTPRQFRNTMENVRNAFDGYHKNPRPGWRGPGNDTAISEKRAQCIVDHHSWDDDQLDRRAFQIAAGRRVWPGVRHEVTSGDTLVAVP